MSGEKNKMSEKLCFGMKLGYKLSKLEWIWGGEYDAELIKSNKEEILSDIKNENKSFDQSDFDSFCNGIFDFYLKKDSEIYYCILIGYSFQRCSVVGGSPIEEYNNELKKLAKAMLDMVPLSFLGNKDSFFELLFKNKNKDIDSVIGLVYDELASDSRINKKEVPYVFVSYCNDDGFGDEIRSILQEKDIPHWMAPYDIPIGSVYADCIDYAIENCECVLLIMGENAQNSGFVLREMERAATYDKDIIPVKLYEGDIARKFKFYINAYQIIEFDNLDKDENIQIVFERLLKYVRPMTAKARKNNSLPVSDQVSLFLSEFKMPDFLDINRYTSKPNKEFSGGIFSVYNKILLIDKNWDEEYFNAVSMFCVWKIIYEMAKEKEYYGLCSFICEVSEDEYLKVKSFISDDVHKQNREFLSNLFIKETTDSEEADYWEKILDELIVLMMLAEREANKAGV